MSEERAASESGEVSAELDWETAVRRPASDLSCEEIVRLFLGFAETARREGIRALEPAAKLADTDEGMIGQGLRLAVDGTYPELIQSMLNIRASGLIRRRKLRSTMIIEGAVSIQCGDNPRIIDQKLRNIYLPTEKDISWMSYEAFTESLREVPCSRRDLDGLREAIANIAETARKSGIEALKALIPLVDEDLLALGLRMATDRKMPDLTRAALETRVQGALNELQVRYRMVATGIRLIQGGIEPEELTVKLRYFYDG